MSLQKNLEELGTRRAAHKKRREGVVDTILSIAAERQSAAAMDASSRTPAVAGPAPAAAGRRLAASGMGHHGGDGHNHPKGSVPTEKQAEELWSRVQKMIAASPHKISPGARSRSYEEQVRLYNLYKSGKGALAAKPGTSKHGSGRANDLKYSSEAARQWALANAKNFGLAMPLYNPKLGRGRDESWHVELGG